MEKKISSKLILGKRSVATLSEQSMAFINGGDYASLGCNSTNNATVVYPAPVSDTASVLFLTLYCTSHSGY